jgi:hypothetical protein
LYSAPNSSYTVGQLTAHSTWTGNYTNLFRYAANTGLNVTGVGTGVTYPNLVMDNNNPVMVATNLQVQGTTTLGTATATTQSADNNSTKVATTAYVDGSYLSNWMPLGTALSTSTGIGFNSSTNHAVVFGLVLRGAVLTSQVSFYLVGADTTGTNTYDIGLYQGTAGSSDNLLLHTGAVTASSYFGTGASFVTIPWTAGSCGVPCVLPPGRYYLALYANESSAPATIGENSAFDINFYHLTSFSITPSSGALPTSITGPTDSLGTSNYPYLALH